MTSRETNESKRQIMWRFPSEDLDAWDRPLSWSGWMCVYMKRWQYWPVWAVARPWRLHFGDDACDEAGRASKIFIFPFLGAFVFFFKNRRCDHEQ